MRQGVIYKIQCSTCQETQKESIYIGESARTMFDGGLEHAKAIQNLDEESPMVEHFLLEHNSNQEPAFTMQAIGFRSTPLWRQAEEANEITKHSDKHILNRRGEWGQNLPPKLSLEATEQVKFQKRKTPPPPL